MVAKENTRKIVLVLGNGFDLDLGLKTSYKSFYESDYCPKNHPSPLFRHLNSLKEDLTNIRWCDLENELLVYAKEGDKSEVITEEERQYLKRNDDYQLTMNLRFYGGDPILKSLAEKEFVTIQGDLLFNVKTPFREDLMLSTIERDKRALKLIEEGLFKYLETTQPSSRERDTVAGRVLISLLNEYDEGNIVDIFSFNYTDLDLIKNDTSNIQVQHMHGSCKNEHIIVGTRYDKGVGRDYDFLLKTRDDDYHPPRIIDSINNADEIIIFGHSFGENDQPYFTDLFNDQLKNNPNHHKDVVIFTLDQESEQNIKRAIDNMIGGQFMRLSTVNPPTIIKTSNLKGKDGWVFKDFLVKHGMKSFEAEVVIGKIVNNQTN